MKKILLIIALLIVINSIFAEESDWFANSESIDLNVDIKGEVNIVQKNADYNILYFIANISFYPKNSFYEKVESIDGNPRFDESKENILFRWDNIEPKKLNFELNSKIRTESNSPKIKSKVKFPINEDIPENYKIYLKPTEKINSDDEEIIKLASELASGEDDLFLIEFNLATWAKKNIIYTLDSTTESASKDASWVMKNKRGVCDELTNLFIAMNRALGIPARYISGLAYTNFNDINDFSGHAWAEVYFPGNGWVPFDVTYEELGFTDASHVFLSYNIDSDKSSVNYQWKSHGIEVKTKPLNITAVIEKKVKQADDKIQIILEPVKQNVDIGSYNLIRAKVINKNDYYIATELSLSKSDGYENQTSLQQDIILKPWEEKSLFWIVKVNDNLEEDYIYTLPVSVKSQQGTTAKTEFKAQSGEAEYSLEQIKSIIEVVNENKVHSLDVKFNCTANAEYYSWEEIAIKCSVENTGNIFLEKLNFCVENSCRVFDLGISQKKSFDFRFNEKSGKKEFFAKLFNNELSETKSIAFNVLDKPEVSINAAKILEVNYNDKFDFEFLVKKESSSEPVEMLVEFSGSRIDEKWDIEKMDKDRRFIISMKGKGLTRENSQFLIKTVFYDKRNNRYEKSENITINLKNLTFFQKIAILLNRFISFFGI